MRYYYALGNSIAPLSGTTQATSSTPSTLVGTGTHYDTELEAGDMVYVDGHFFSVVSISTATSAIIAEDVTTGDIGGTAYLLQSLQALKVPWPKHTFKGYVDQRRLGNGHLRNMGRPLATWTWTFIPLTPRGALRTYCPSPAASAEVLISTRINEGDAFQVFSAVMEWPEELNKDTGMRMNFVINFSNLVPVAE